MGIGLQYSIQYTIRCTIWPLWLFKQQALDVVNWPVGTIAKDLTWAIGLEGYLRCNDPQRPWLLPLPRCYVSYQVSWAPTG